MLKRTATIASFFLLSGCVAELSQDGRMVREIQADWSNKCRFLGVVDASEGNAMDYIGDRRGSLNSLRNKIAAIGGNAFVITQSLKSDPHALLQADSYKCPEGN